MCCENRQAETNEQIIKTLGKDCDKVIRVQPSKPGECLEGTGSLIFDLANYKVYCCLSERAHLSTLNAFMTQLNRAATKKFELITFDATD